LRFRPAAISLLRRVFSPRLNPPATQQNAAFSFKKPFCVTWFSPLFTSPLTQNYPARTLGGPNAFATLFHGLSGCGDFVLLCFPFPGKLAPSLVVGSMELWVGPCSFRSAEGFSRSPPEYRPDSPPILGPFSALTQYIVDFTPKPSHYGMARFRCLGLLFFSKPTHRVWATAFLPRIERFFLGQKILVYTGFLPRLGRCVPLLLVFGPHFRKMRLSHAGLLWFAGSDQCGRWRATRKLFPSLVFLFPFCVLALGAPIDSLASFTHPHKRSSFRDRTNFPFCAYPLLYLFFSLF